LPQGLGWQALCLCEAYRTELREMRPNSAARALRRTEQRLLGTLLHI